MTDRVNAIRAGADARERIEALRLLRWPADEAQAWCEARPWLCGFNFLPSTAVNFIDMWQRETFDAETIERELRWARDIGFNTLRTNLPFGVWQADRDGLVERVDRFLAIADGSGLSTMLCLMDDCGFSGDGPVLGPQPDPLPGVHNSRAVASPGRRVVMTPSAWIGVEAYVRDLVTHFAADPRILAWDVYNEPGNLMIFAPDGEHAFDSRLEAFSHRLMIEAFSWCRDVGPSQPLTVAAWRVPSFGEEPAAFYENEIDRTALALSDIVSFHAYTSSRRVARIIEQLRAFRRPILCTEWMARQAGSRIEDQLSLFHRERVGAFQWGLVNGRTQTHIPWPTVISPAVSTKGEESWFHDLLGADGKPYREAETREIRRLTKS